MNEIKRVLSRHIFIKCDGLRAMARLCPLYVSTINRHNSLVVHYWPMNRISDQGDGSILCVKFDLMFENHAPKWKRHFDLIFVISCTEFGTACDENVTKLGTFPLQCDKCKCELFHAGCEMTTGTIRRISNKPLISMRLEPPKNRFVWQHSNAFCGSTCMQQTLDYFFSLLYTC